MRLNSWVYQLIEYFSLVELLRIQQFHPLHHHSLDAKSSCHNQANMLPMAQRDKLRGLYLVELLHRNGI
jgi:exonuclease I